MDLLGGVDMNAQVQPPSNENALNFFESPANTSVLDQAANANQAQSPFDFGGNTQDPFSQPNPQKQAAEKPKFVPNPAFLSGM